MKIVRSIPSDAKALADLNVLEVFETQGLHYLKTASSRGVLALEGVDRGEEVYIEGDCLVNPVESTLTLNKKSDEPTLADVVLKHYIESRADQAARIVANVIAKGDPKPSDFRDAQEFLNTLRMLIQRTAASELEYR